MWQNKAFNTHKETVYLHWVTYLRCKIDFEGNLQRVVRALTSSLTGITLTLLNCLNAAMSWQESHSCYHSLLICFNWVF